MYIAKKLLWIYEYVQEAKKIVPEIKRVKSIRSHIPSLKRVQNCQAQITKYEEKNKKTYYTITIFIEALTQVKMKPRPKFTRTPYSRIDILSHLAHELAHLREWEHTPAHKILESELMKLFMKILKKSGYVSEEVESKQGVSADETTGKQKK